MARLAIVDDHDRVRAGIKAMLYGETDLEVVGEAADGGEAIELCRRVRPDLMLMDVRMPQVDGLTATRALKGRYPEVSVLILTMHENQDYLLEAVKAGAAGYLLKDTPQHELVTAIRRVLEGETTLDQRLATRLLQWLVNGAGAPPQGQLLRESTPLLTPRELEVLKPLALGRTNPEIARELTITVGTVKNHVEHVISKLGVSDRTQAVVKALELGLIAFPKQ